MNPVQCKICKRFFGWTMTGESLDRQQDFSGLREFQFCDRNHDGDLIKEY